MTKTPAFRARVTSEFHFFSFLLALSGSHNPWHQLVAQGNCTLMCSNRNSHFGRTRRSRMKGFKITDKEVNSHMCDFSTPSSPTTSSSSQRNRVCCLSNQRHHASILHQCLRSLKLTFSFTEWMEGITSTSQPKSGRRPKDYSSYWAAILFLYLTA